MGGVDLTTQQKSRLRKAYRDTFEAEDQAQAVRAFYERFVPLYGMTVDEIWDFLSDERAKRPPVQSLREVPEKRTAANTAKSTSPGKSYFKPTPIVRAVQPAPGRKPVRGKRVCEVCGRKVGATTYRGVVRHKARNGQWCLGDRSAPIRREKRTCPICKLNRGVRQTDGRMVSHKDKSGQQCEGSGRSPVEGRSAQYVTVAPAKVIGGGLPGLGKRG